MRYAPGFEQPPPDEWLNPSGGPPAVVDYGAPPPGTRVQPPGAGLSPQFNMQRDNITKALMGIRNPPGGFNTGLPGQEPGWEAPMPPPQVEPPFQVSGATSPPIPQRDVYPTGGWPGGAPMPGGTPPGAPPPMGTGMPPGGAPPMGGGLPPQLSQMGPMKPRMY